MFVLKSSSKILARRRCAVTVVTNVSTNSSAEYCMNLVKTHDYENFASTILLKEPARSCAFAVRSFNVEIAKVAEQVTQKDIGLMRMQFWEDALEKCFLKQLKQVPRHPVTTELHKAISSCRLSKRYLKNLILSRKEYLNLNGFSTIEDLEKYCEQSVSSVYYLILEGCGIRNIDADHAASHLGKAQGIVQQLRAIPHCRQLNFIPLPQNVLVKNNVSHEEILRGKSCKSLSDCVYEVAVRGHQHLQKSKSLEEKVPTQGRDTFLPSVAVLNYLNRLQNVDYDIFSPKLKHRSWNLLIKLWLTHLTNKYTYR